VAILGIGSAVAPAPIIWMGDNDNGQPLSSGTYYLKMDTVDAFGHLSSYSQAVTAMGKLGGNSLAIYNSAGELVRNIPLQGYPSDLSDFSVSGQTLAGGGELQVDLTDGSGNSHLVTWDGTSGSGAPVASGVYSLKLVRLQAGQSQMVKTRSITVLNAPGGPAEAALAGARLGPNPFPGQGQLIIDYPPLAGGGGVSARIYNIAGEWVAQGSDQGGGRLLLDLGRLAPGAYLADLEARTPHGGARTTLKFAVIH
jgi:flagellar hook assembly protein FlgD